MGVGRHTVLDVQRQPPGRPPRAIRGLGESQHAHVGISLPGTGETPAAQVLGNGAKVTTLRGDNIATECRALLDQYMESRDAPRDAAWAGGLCSLVERRQALAQT